MRVLEIRDISFRYDATQVLDRVSMAVEQGEFVCVTGSNGSGKSTLLKLILGMLPLHQGEILLFSKEHHQFGQWWRVGYIPQSLQALSGGFPATAAEIVLTGLYAKIGPLRLPGKKHRQMALDALELVGMKEYAARPVSALSGGQQQRVMLARVLAGQPELLLLDEPSSGVDPENSEALYELLSSLCKSRGLSVVMVTHDMERSLRFADTVFCMEKGNLLHLSKEQLRHELAHRHRHEPGRDCCDCCIKGGGCRD